jgi:large-conductance mechanosensitive channel
LMNTFLQIAEVDPAFMGIFKFVFIVALILVFAISVFLVIGLGKAKKDEEKKMALQEKQVKLTEESLAVLKDIKKNLGGNNVSLAQEEKSA